MCALSHIASDAALSYTGRCRAADTRDIRPDGTPAYRGEQIENSSTLAHAPTGSAGPAALTWIAAWPVLARVADASSPPGCSATAQDDAQPERILRHQLAAWSAKVLILRNLVCVRETENENCGPIGGGDSLQRTRLQPKFPANREKYREFHTFLRFTSRPTSPRLASRATLRPSTPSPGTMWNRELIRAYQGIYREEQGILAPPCLRKNLPKLF